MIKLNFDIPQFVSIPLQDCLNYDIYPNLENIIKNIVESSFNKMNSFNLNSREQKIEYFLQHALLRLSANNTWLNLSKENNLDQLYLYKMIRKYLYLKDPEFLS